MARTRATRAFDDTCDACQQMRVNPSGQPNTAHTCGSQQTNPRKGPVRRCERKGKGWAWVADTDFIEKTAVPKDLDFPASSKKTGKNLLKPSHKHYKDNNGVYETTDAHGNTVYYAHEGSL